jgi:colanic acid biosynthesis glycosyl transferase WcaI
MRILLLSQYFPPGGGLGCGQDGRYGHVPQGRRGHQVEVVSQVPSYPQGLVSPGYEGVWFRREFSNGVPVTRTWAYTSPDRSLFKPRLYNYVSFMGTSLGGILAGSFSHLILLYSTPQVPIHRGTSFPLSIKPPGLKIPSVMPD